MKVYITQFQNQRYICIFMSHTHHKHTHTPARVYIYKSPWSKLTFRKLYMKVQAVMFLSRTWATIFLTHLLILNRLEIRYIWKIRMNLLSKARRHKMIHVCYCVVFPDVCLDDDLNLFLLFTGMKFSAVILCSGETYLFT